MPGEGEYQGAMSLLSILLSVVAVLCTVLGFLTTPVPVLGAALSFGAAAIALGGIMLAGRAMSRAKLQERPSDTARIGVVLNVLALVPALLVALTCGVCNALVSTGNIQANPNFRFNVGQPGSADPDADPGQPPQPLAPPARAGAGHSAPKVGHRAAPASGAPATGHGNEPPAAPAAPPPPSNLPPPPLPAGPRS
jgi:hypothetical protein